MSNSLENNKTTRDATRWLVSKPTAAAVARDPGVRLGFRNVAGEGEGSVCYYYCYW